MAQSPCQSDVGQSAGASRGSIYRATSPTTNRAHAADPHRFVRDDDAVRARGGIGDRVVVERPDRAQVDDGGFDPVALERGGGFERAPDRDAVGDDRDVAAVRSKRLQYSVSLPLLHSVRN